MAESPEARWRGARVDGERPTLGWEVIDFIQSSIVVPDGEYEGEKFILSAEQRDFVLGMYELRPEAKVDLLKPSRAFMYPRGGQLVAPQKWGKGPLSAAIIIAEAYGPVLFGGWNAEGEPVGRPWATPWIQVTAVSEDQTDNVWRALIPMIRRGGLSHEIPDTGETRINLPGGGRIEPVTASARSRLGQRITFSVQDEAHDWMKRNGGRKLADTQRRNLAGMGGRFLETGNAWDPAEDSVAQQTHEREDGVYKMMLHGGVGSVRNKRERMRVLRQLYGESWWVDPERISEEIDNLIRRGDYAQAERFFMNRIVPAEDRAIDLRRWESLAQPTRTVEDQERIVIGVDGARYRDALAVVACDLSTGFLWPLGIWERPEGASPEYEHPFDEVDGVMIDAWERWDVWRVYIDPGSQIANIAPLMERWQGRWGERKIIEWLMSRPKPTAYMVRRFTSAVQSGDVAHDGNPVLTQHIGNARRRLTTVRDEDGREMHTFQKEAPDSPLKIDGASAAALAWEARGDAISAGAVTPGQYDDPAYTCARCGHLRRHHVREGCRVRPPGHCTKFEEKT